MTLIQAGLTHPDQETLSVLERTDRYPRIILFQKILNADMLDEKFLAAAPSWRRSVYRFLPVNLAQVLEAFIIRRRYDVIISWAENLGIPLALLFRLTGTRHPHFGIFSWISKPKKAVFLKRLHQSFDRIILMSSRQWAYAVNVMKVPKEKAVLLRWPVDQAFWRPMDVPSDMICSVGREMRDYRTLVQALEGTGIRCHIAAGGTTSNKKDQWMRDLRDGAALPDTITLGRKSYSELRDLYARSRFVVIPLFPTETDNGSTSILEAMAMGKAVICTQVEGQADVIRHGENGLFVPPGDPAALRSAIERLWNDPEAAEQMGRAGRAFIERHHSFDSFVSNIRALVDETLEEKQQQELERRQRRSAPTRPVLTVVTEGLRRPNRARLRRLEEDDAYPRSLIYEDTLDSDILDESYLRSLPWPKRTLYRFMPTIAAQVVEAFLVRGRYSAVVTWSGRIGLPYAFLLKLFRSRQPHIALVTWISRPKKAALLRWVHTHIDRMVLWSSVQKEFAVKTIGIPGSRIVQVGRRVDHRFWRPGDGPTDMICSSGQEMRDYPTLIKALEGLDLRCHIATGALRGELFSTVKALHAIGDLPANITVGMLSYTELRDLYRRSRFVVIPLHQTDTDNGVTVIEESMAMGKAVICTRTKGQVDIIQENVTGIFVPPYDPAALRAAILHLWNNPDIARRMGEAGRAHIERYHTIDRFVADVKSVVDDAVAEHRRR